jgi:hypothetical protein
MYNVANCPKNSNGVLTAQDSLETGKKWCWLHWSSHFYPQIFKTYHKNCSENGNIQRQFLVYVKKLADVIEKFWNPFEDESNELLVLDSRRIFQVKRLLSSLYQNGKKMIKNWGKNQCQTHFLEIMSKSSKKWRPAANTPMKSKLDASRKNRELLHSLYISSQFRSNDLTNFFSHENEMFPPKLTSEGEIQSTPQSDLIPLMLGSYHIYIDPRWMSQGRTENSFIVYILLANSGLMTWQPSLMRMRCFLPSFQARWNPKHPTIWSHSSIAWRYRNMFWVTIIYFSPVYSQLILDGAVIMHMLTLGEAFWLLHSRRIHSVYSISAHSMRKNWRHVGCLHGRWPGNLEQE